MKQFVVIVLALALLLGSAAGEAQGLDPENNSRVFYEIFVGSFSDSNGDGVGDLRGIINRMDYLNDGDPASGKSLGIEGIWLTPIFLSPSYHKYDVTDYYQIDPSFGTLEDLRELIALCHQRDVKLILDLPLNHTGSNSRWFKNFSNAHLMHNPENAYYDFYTWISPEDPVPAGRHFTKLPSGTALYESNFSDHMPELNFDNEAVRRAVLDVAEYWLNVGVDGFRFDAAKYIYFGEHDKNVDFWVWYMAELRTNHPDLYAVAEVWDGDGVIAQYLPAFNCFHFSVSQAEGIIAATAKGGDVNKYTRSVEKYLSDIHGVNSEAMDIPFIANHDTDRAAGYLSMANGRMQVAASLYLLSPGSPFIYYGEEIGLRGSRGGENTDANRRLAMVWNDGDTVSDPEGSTYKSQVEQGVAEQLADKDSLLNYYKELLMIRHANPEIARGAYRSCEIPGTKLGGFYATWKGRTVLVLHNTTLSAATVDLSGLGVKELRAAIGVEGASLDGTSLTLGAQTSVVLR